MKTVAAPSTTSGIDAALSAVPPVVYGQIAGRVTSAVSGAALADVEVSVDGEGAASGQAVTNANGEYTVSSLSAGSYTMSFYRGERGGNYLAQSDNGVSVTGGSTTVFDAEMQLGGQMEGTVTAVAGGAAIGGIEVCASSDTGIGCAITDASGEYTIIGLVSDSYIVEFSPPRDEGGGYLAQYYDAKSSEAEAEAVPVVAGGSPTSGIDAALSLGGQITGKVTAASGGAVLAGASVCARGENEPPPPPPAEVSGEVGPHCTTTNAGGEYAIVGLSTGSYALRFRPGDEDGNYLPQSAEVQVTAGSTTSGIDAALSPGGQITGRVTAASGGAPLVGIEVCEAQPHSLPPFVGFGCTVTDANGEYTISSLPSGAYNVEFRSEGGNYLPVSDDGVSVTAGSTTSGIDAALASGGKISGTVTAAAGGAPLGGIRVCASSIGGGGGGGCATTNAADGSASATSNALVVPGPDSDFSLVRAPVFDARTGDLDFYIKVTDAGTLQWSLSVADRELAVAGGARTSRRRRHARMPFGAASKRVPAGVVEVRVHADAKVLKALKAGRTLHVSGPFAFQSVLGGTPVVHMESAMVRWPKKAKHGRIRHRHRAS